MRHLFPFFRIFPKVIVLFIFCITGSIKVNSQNTYTTATALGTLTCAGSPYTNIANGNTTGAGNECGNTSEDRWYSFTITATSDVTVSLCGSGYDTFLRIYNGGAANCGSATQIASNDDNGPSCAGTRSSITQTSLTPGTYIVMVEGFGSNNGAYQLDINVTNCATPMVYSSIAVTQASTATVAQSSQDQQILRVEVITTGLTSPFDLTQLRINLQGSNLVTDITGVNVYYTGNSTAFSTATLFGTVAVPGATATYVDISGTQTLTSGSNYFWLAYDISPTAVVGDFVDGRCRQVIVDGIDRLSNTIQNPAGNRQIVAVTPSPGNVGITNLTAWWKADALANGNVTSWSTSYPSGGSAIAVSDGSAPYSQCTNTPTANIFNYNSVVDFNGNGALSNRYLTNTGAYNLLTNQSAGNTGTFFVVYALPTAGNTDGVVSFKNGQHGVQMRAYGRLAIGEFNSTNGTRDFTPNPVTKPLIISYKGNKSSGASMNAFRNDLTFTAGGASSALMETGISMGAKQTAPAIWAEYFSGYLSEVIFYDADLSNTDINKINSYVGIKYGVTLDNTGGGVQGDYTAANGTTIWDASINPAYHNDVIGIGRDDNQTLLQKQSHTFDDVSRIYLNTLSATNVSNGGAFSSDASYLVAGHNSGAMCGTPAIYSEVPAACGLFSRIEREWKITKTNMSDNFSFDVRLNACGTPGSVVISELRFLVDDDGDFSNGGTTCYFNGDATGTVISYSNPVISVSGISNSHIANNSTRYVTIGSIAQTTPLPVELLNFNAKCIDNNTTLTWTTASEINNDYFTIERSFDGIDFDEITTANGNGNSSSSTTYQWIDKNNTNQTSYYRLKQTDFDGNTVLLETKAITCNNIRKISIYPNPFNNSFTINLDENTRYPITLEIRDYLGRLVHNQIIKANNTNIAIDKKLINGTYAVKIFNETSQLVKKVIKINN